VNNGKPTTIRHLRAGSNERHHQSLGGVMIHTAAEPQLSGTGSLYRAAAMYWLVLAGTATAAGIAQETWLVPRLGELRSHQLGTMIVCASFLAVIATFVRQTRPTPRNALAIGACWLAIAILFEFGVGHLVDGLSWSRLLSDYDLSRGRLLLLVWLTVGLGPLVITRMRGRSG
jgi:hypothetical protein